MALGFPVAPPLLNPHWEPPLDGTRLSVLSAIATCRGAFGTRLIPRIGGSGGVSGALRERVSVKLPEACGQFVPCRRTPLHRPASQSPDGRGDYAVGRLDHSGSSAMPSESGGRRHRPGDRVCTGHNRVGAGPRPFPADPWTELDQVSRQGSLKWISAVRLLIGHVRSLPPYGLPKLLSYHLICGFSHHEVTGMPLDSRSPTRHVAPVPQCLLGSAPDSAIEARPRRA